MLNNSALSTNLNLSDLIYSYDSTVYAHSVVCGGCHKEAQECNYNRNESGVLKLCTSFYCSHCNHHYCNDKSCSYCLIY